MSFDSERFTHEADRAALKALKALPGFTMLTKAFLNMWNEPQERIMNMSTRIKLGENQMRKYYDMLPPICEKLGIAVPDLYLELNVTPNAYTYGDTNPFIVVSSGLLETMPDELIPTVLAHECGHIACHHVLYRTMGRTVLNGAAAAISYFLKIGGLLTVPLQVAFFHWMRCSEFSADRAAVLCDGSPRKMQEVCMRLAGWDKDIQAEANIEEFLKQAKNYREMINESAWNKTLEFLVLSDASHPLMAVRATECGEWANSEQFRRILNDLPEPEEPAPEAPQEKRNNDPFDFFGWLRPEREEKPAPKQEDTPPEEDSEAQKELRWYRKMAEEGLITKEQYEQKKKELLG